MSEAKVMSSIQFPNTQEPYQVKDARIPDNPGSYKTLNTDANGNYVAERASVYKVTDMTPGYVNVKTGAFGTGGNWQRTDYIPVSSGDVVTFSGRIGDNMGVAGYDENKAFVASVLDRIDEGSANTYANEPLTIPDGVAYIAGCTNSPSNPITVMVYKDAKALVDAGGGGLPSGGMELPRIAFYQNAQSNTGAISCNLSLEECLTLFNASFESKTGGFPDATLTLVHPSGMHLIIYANYCYADRYFDAEDNESVSLKFSFAIPGVEGASVILYSVDGFEMISE